MITDPWYYMDELCRAYYTSRNSLLSTRLNPVADRWETLNPVNGEAGLSNLTSGLLDLCRSVILAFPFNIRFFSTGPLVVDFDEHGANQAFE